MINDAEKRNLKAGFKEVMNLISEKRAAKVVLAADCDDKIKTPILEAANAAGITVEYAETMRELGKACGIDVGASCAAMLKF